VSPTYHVLDPGGAARWRYLANTMDRSLRRAAAMQSIATVTAATCYTFSVDGQLYTVVEKGGKRAAVDGSWSVGRVRRPVTVMTRDVVARGAHQQPVNITK